MKMRKALSFVLVLALVLGSFSMAFAATPINQGSDLSDIADSANYDAIVANSDLGIITGYEDGSFKPENNVNRAEFAAMITRMMGVPESALGGYSATAFTDMNGYGWAASYVGFCAAKGIVNGYGDGTFGPGNTITVNEAITMVLRAVGYVNNSNELVGNWPANYVTLGKRLGLYDDVTSVATIDRENAAQVIYNALTCVVVAVDADGKTDAAYTQGGVDKTVLEVYLDASAPAWTVLKRSDALASVINTMDYIGAYVKVFENKDGEIIAIAEVGSDFLTGEYNAADKVFKAGGVKYNMGDATATVANLGFSVKNTAGGTDDLAAVVLENGVAGTIVNVTQGTDTTRPAAANPTTMADGVSATLAVKLSGKTIKEVYSINEWDPADTFKFEADMLDAKTLNGYKFELDDNDKIDTYRFSLLGADSLDKIEEDNVVKVYLSNGATGNIVKVTVGTEVVKGKVTLKDGSDYTIGGKVYAGPSTGINLGDTGTAYLDYDGDIAIWDVENADSDNYAMVTGDLTAGPRNHTVILLDKEGNEKEYVVKSSAVINDETGAAYANFTAAEAGIVDDSLVTFALDKNGQITKLNLITGATGFTASTALELSASRTIYGTDRVDSGVVIFAKNGAADYSVVSIDNVKTKAALTGTATYLNDGKIKAMIIPKQFAGADSVYAVLNFVESAYNNDDDKVQLVRGFADGKAYEAYTDDEGTFITVGDYVYNTVSESVAPEIAELSVNSDGTITNVEAKGTVTIAKQGYVIVKDGRDLGLHSTDSDGAAVPDPLDRGYAAIADKALVYVFDKSDGEFSLGTWSSIKAKTAGAAGLYVYIYEVDGDMDGYDIVVVIQD